MMKLSKSERKLRKKQAKSQHTLLKHDGIKASDIPTKILCVNNAGLDSGVSRDEVQELFEVYGGVEDVIMMPQKPYAFVCYQTEEEAEKAYENLNGKTLVENDDRKWPVKLYISYVSQVPSSLSPSDDLPPGLILLENFITQEYAEKMLESIDWHEEASHGMQRELKHREVKHYGYEFKYGINDVDVDDPLPQGVPAMCRELLDTALKTGHIKYLPDQVTVNKYLPGQGIPPHVDTPAAFEDGIMSLSLGSQVLMDFRHPNGKHLSVLLPPCSLLIMTGESRYLWSHGITPRKSDIIPTPDGRLTIVHRGTRTSYTFRKIIPPKDRINRHIPFVTESRQHNPTILPQSASDAASLEETHVHKVYEEIADHFSGTRHSPWPRIADFIRTQPVGSILVDIGCGNGKYLGINKDIYEVGSDRSFNLAKICRSRDFPVFVSDVMSIPIRSGVCDVCICIAVLHHLSTEERRLHGISELLRILRPGGKALIYVWAMEQELHKVKSKYLKEVKVTGSLNGNVKDTDTETEKVKVTDSTADLLEKDTVKQIDNKSLPKGDAEKENIISVKKSSETECDDRQEVQLSSPSFDRHETPEYEVTKKRGVCGQASDKAQNQCSSSMIQSSSNMLEIHKNRTNFKQQDMLVPWQLKNKAEASVKDRGDSVFHRYYHVFRQGELEALCQRLENCQVRESYYDQGNWAVILQKL
ncbi:alkylated DNA repair protein alkB homolog 8-like [Ylistrum balloti]|uniref:alkylated DNA repair protein alkB homolog 8-like n=1 Tax=Ylistrum balloti TaxID=509963 RepID=UPI002905BDB6|nr:alkylated DNA repair protein alkB homolog 8-like [Ylistrum balloti]